MKKNFVSLSILLLSLSSCYLSCLYLNGKYLLAGVFFAGTLFGKLNSYKRELEKESVSSDEASAKVKVLESKIKVLEKALENALNK